VVQQRYRALFSLVLVATLMLAGCASPGIGEAARPQATLLTHAEDAEDTHAPTPTRAHPPRVVTTVAENTPLAQAADKMPTAATTLHPTSESGNTDRSTADPAVEPVAETVTGTVSEAEPTVGITSRSQGVLARPTAEPPRSPMDIAVLSTRDYASALTIEEPLEWIDL